MMPLSARHMPFAAKNILSNGSHPAALGLRSISSTDVVALFRSSFMLYCCFLMMGSWIYHQLGGSFSDMYIIDALGYLSSAAEHIGLLVLRRKIERQGSVSGISGMSMTMYAIVYAVRFSMFPEFSILLLDAWAVKAGELISLLLVLDVLRCVWRTYRESYHDDLDPLKVQHLVPGCLLLVMLLRPELRQGMVYNVVWTSCLYMDVLALMPQVVMMSKGGGRVEAPISHFVAATALSRSVDLWFWYFAFESVGPENLGAGINWSGWLIVFFHVLHLLLVADFMYYYIKAKISGSGFSQDLDIPDV